MSGRPPAPPQPDRPKRPQYVIKATGAEAKAYDYAAARLASGPIKTTNLFETVANLVKACLGGGIVAIHEAYQQCGLFSSLLINIIVGMCLIHNKYILVTSAQIMYGRLQLPSMSYPDLAEAVVQTGPFPKLQKYSSVFRYLVDATICINLFGACTCYTVVIAKSIKQIVEDAKLGGVISIRLYIVFLLIPCILIAMIVALKYLAPFSILGNIILLTVAGATIYYGSQAATMSPLDFPSFKTAEGFFEFLGVCVFSMEGMGQILPIENHMKDPKQFPMALCIDFFYRLFTMVYAYCYYFAHNCMSTVVGLVATIGFFGYWGFGEASKSPVTLNFPWEPFPIVLKCMLALTVYITFGLNLWSPFNLIWFYIKKRHNPAKYWWLERLYRAIVVSILISIACMFPNVSAFLGLLGSFCISLIGFIYPAFIELAVKWEDPGLGSGKWRLYKFVIILLCGLFICFFGSYSNLKKLLTTTV